MLHTWELVQLIQTQLQEIPTSQLVKEVTVPAMDSKVPVILTNLMPTSVNMLQSVEALVLHPVTTTISIKASMKVVYPVLHTNMATAVTLTR